MASQNENLELEGDIHTNEDDRLVIVGTDHTGFIWGGIPLEMIIQARIPRIQKGGEVVRVRINIASVPVK